jgi:hypothetical protein
MSSSYAQREAAALHFMLTRLQEEGYSVFAQPSHAMLPTFLRGYRPDAIALKDGKKRRDRGRSVGR